eukprot:3313322-Alexandrium_andersonii.AAC.1
MPRAAHSVSHHHPAETDTSTTDHRMTLEGSGRCPEICDTCHPYLAHRVTSRELAWIMPEPTTWISRIKQKDGWQHVFNTDTSLARTHTHALHAARSQAHGFCSIIACDMCSRCSQL